jgi:hypothetical protein
MQLSLLLAAALLTQPEPKLDVEITFAKSALAEPFSGRVFVVATKSARSGQPGGISWMNPQPFFAQDVTKWQPDTPLKFKPAFAFPKTWDELGKEKWHLQAVLDCNLGSANCITGAGNLYSPSAEYDPEKPGTVKLVIDRAIPQPTYTDTERVKFVEIPSPLLSGFYCQAVKLRARVVLPKSFADGKKSYPIVFEIPGFGGRHTLRHMFESKDDVDGLEMIYVMLDPNCRTGHHVFADSDNNGPYGKSLVEELIPHIEKEFRGLGIPAGRLLTGHSSGGWSSLWLQVTYPDFFGGTWSTAPDPVDFRDFQRINIYEPGTNMFVDAKGEQRPLARRGDKIMLRFKPFSDMEVVMGHGGQLQSFEAVFGPRDARGQVVPLWDRTTGAIDPKVAKAWERYDIRLSLERDWKTLGPKLAGKLHVFTGAEDTFLLDGASRLLQKSLKELGSDAVVEIVNGKDHGSLRDAGLRERIAKEMARSVRHAGRE